MPRGGAILLGDLVGWIEWLEIRCTRCDRHRFVGLTKLIEQHGANATLPLLKTRLEADCPMAEAHYWGERCFVYFPQMTKLFPPGGDRR